MPEPYYAVADDLRAEAGVDSTTLPDASANRIIQDAEDIIDEELGVHFVDIDTGRKIVQANVEPWRWIKLSRATTKLATRLYVEPDLVRETHHQHVAGPDFSFSRATTANYGDDIEALLNQSGLRRKMTHSGGRPARPSWYTFSFNDTSYEDADSPSEWSRYGL